MGAEAQIKARIVFKDGANASEDGACPRAPSMAISPRLGTRDPLALAILQGSLTVQACGNLHSHPRFLTRHATQKAWIQGS